MDVMKSMLRSMTGYGGASLSAAGYRLQVDLKSVNHRYFEIMVRMPREWLQLEDALKKRIQQEVKRGRIDVFVTIEHEGASGRSVQVDWAVAEAYAEAARQLKERLGLQGEAELKDFLQIPDVIVMRDETTDDRQQAEIELLHCLDDALQQLIFMRKAEGGALYSDLDKRLAIMREHHAKATALAPMVTEEYRTKLASRISEIAGNVMLDEQRLALEVAVFADRSNVDEELTRLDSHFNQFGLLLEASDPAGRKLDFLIQEMNREINTIGSKANHAELSGIVVEMKAELEKMREQVQNIE